MKQIYSDNNLYVVLPSKIVEDKFVQQPQDITIVNKNKEIEKNDLTSCFSCGII